MTPPWATDGTAVRDDYAAGLWAYALTGRQKLPVYKSVLYYSASKRYFRAPKARGGGISMSSMLQRNDLGGWF